MRYDFYSESNSISPGHEDNQDSLLTDPRQQVFAVADGVGGYQGGKEASQLAIEVLADGAGRISNEASMKLILEEINKAVRARAKALGYENMGTTIAVAKIISNAKGAKIITGNVGDSPILLFPSGEDERSFRYVFADDSHRDANPGSMWGITQYLGLFDTEIDFHARSFDCASEDMLLICSDGVTDNLLNPGVRARMRLPEVARRFRSARKIVEEALRARIKPDDMTAVLISI